MELDSCRLQSTCICLIYTGPMQVQVYKIKQYNPQHNTNHPTSDRTIYRHQGWFPVKMFKNLMQVKSWGTSGNHKASAVTPTSVSTEAFLNR